ncbi:MULTISPECIES: FCD domain-containing protein [unclassified Chelatococcus]|uniref:FadR/GntR family transcriptional regulator n=1 Tax=unclassified Chelatococcus TaxID=2638111 RepID=UPI001BCE7B14|nr:MULTISPECIES: FCD domain-containing protein [unclassified Chelatococcus]MBS7696147.1 FadR family transcriptional regulator [Chelatococcus sp. YT9]MBX3557826.1 FadR family transcriptional regulator [Chelatococcus sp.]
MSDISEQESRVDAAYRHLVAYIERENVPEGSRLPSESEFVERFGLSRASIREALARLRAEGRAVSRRGSGTFTARGLPAELVRLSAIDSVQDLIDWHEFRVALESEVAALAAERRDDADLARIHTAQDALMAKLESEHGQAEDAEFHRSIAVAAHNGKLLDGVGALANHIFRWSGQTRERGILTLGERREIIAAEHGEIINAIVERKPDQARFAIRRHLLNGRARFLGTLRL